MITSQDELYAYLGNNISFEGKTWKLVCARIPENKEPVIIQTALQRGFDENPVVIHGHYAVMLIDVTYEDIGQRQINELHHIAATYQCTLGISVGFDHILQCREQMLCLAEHPQMIRKQVGVFDYNLCKENLLLFSSRFEKERLLKLIGGKLQEIREYDQKNNTAYFDTIRAYLNCSYHIQRTAESLHTHKNTLLYRLTRIQEVFGIDLRNNQDIYAINLGLSTLHYFNII